MKWNEAIASAFAVMGLGLAYCICRTGYLLSPAIGGAVGMYTLGWWGYVVFGRRPPPAPFVNALGRVASCFLQARSQQNRTGDRTARSPKD